jgi:hypothetical protein
MLLPGIDGDPLPAGTLIFRIGTKLHLSPEALDKKRALPEMFKPSSRDEESAGRRLSIWVEELTLPDQAWVFAGCDPEKAVVACLNSDAVRAIQAPEPFDSLDLEWEQALLDDGGVNVQPGAQGHAGIAGLCQGGKGKRDSNRRKALRSKLADIATISPTPARHEIPDEHLRLAAYYIYEKENERNASQIAHWIKAIRQLRRARVLEQQNRVG